MPKKAPPEINSCNSCRCFVADSPKGEDGDCKRYPPIPVVINDAVLFTFPRVTRDEVCGEFSQRLQS
jgi:hypothetical protein